MIGLARRGLLLMVIVIGLTGLYGSEEGCEGPCFPNESFGRPGGTGPDLPPAVPDPVVSIDDRGNGLAAYAENRNAIIRRLTGAAGFAEPVTVGSGVEEDLDVVLAGGRARLVWRGRDGRISVLSGDGPTGTFDVQTEVATNAADDPIFANGTDDTVERSFLAWRVAENGADGRAVTRGYGSISLLPPHTILTRYSANEDVNPATLFDLHTAASGGRVIAVWTAVGGTDSSLAHLYAAIGNGGEWGEAHLLARVPRTANLKLAVDMDAEGNAIVVWTQSEGLFFNRYSAAFQSWFDPALLSAEPAAIRELRVDVASSGRAIAAWSVAIAVSGLRRTIGMRPRGSISGAWIPTNRALCADATCALRLIGSGIRWSCGARTPACTLTSTILQAGPLQSCSAPRKALRISI